MDDRYRALVSKLKELFELDKADLDFGIYRILAAKNEEITAFLTTRLRQTVKDELAAHGVGDAREIRRELEETEDQLRKLSAPLDGNEKLDGLRKRLKEAEGSSGAGMEADVYNHLLAFFGRYYDAGDFVSKRRYKGDAYAVPYGGEEVVLHWANKDQHYIKSGEHHTDYAFKVKPGTPGSGTVRFKLVAATSEANNNKEADDAKRRFLLAAGEAVTVDGDTLTVRFEHREPTKAEVKDAAAGKVAVFGGDYAKKTPKKGDAREQFAAAAEVAIREALPEDWADALLVSAETPSKPDRTLLGKHLNDYTARNAFDYFIHKDLRGFLRRELDFYLKNEVMHLDDLERLDAGHLHRVQGRVIAIRRVAQAVIELLAGIESFQLALWNKRKFVLGTHWLVSVSLVPADLRDALAGSTAQWTQWEALGFKPDDASPGEEGWGTRAYLDAHGGLVADTSVIADPAWTDALLAGFDDLDAATTGMLVHSENYGGLRTLEPCLKGELDCVYIDPPYNTDASPIIYKNGYKRSSWIVLMAERITRDIALRKSKAMRCVAIDDAEYAEMVVMIGAASVEQHHATAVIRSKPQGRPTTSGFSANHEYMVFHGAEDAEVGRLPRRGSRLERYPHEDELGIFSWANFRKSGRDSDREDRPKSYYPLYIKDEIVRVPSMEWNEGTREWEVLEAPSPGEVEVWPSDEAGKAKVWDWSSARAESDAADLRPTGVGDNLQISRKYRPNQLGALPGTWWDDADYSASESGTKVLKDLFGQTKFDFPKSLHLVKDAILVCMSAKDGQALDYFAGSGTTGHAVLNLNREDGGSRRFVLIEMGAYFHTVLKPRIAKVMYGPDWKDGRATTHDRPQPGLVKCFALESYDDALDNLHTAPTEGAPALDYEADDPRLLRYALDLQHGPELFNLEMFRNPWGRTLSRRGTDGEAVDTPVDLVETFHCLIGLRVTRRGPVRRSDAALQSADHDEKLGKIATVRGLEEAEGGRFAFQRIDGRLPDGTPATVIWRTVTGDAAEDAATLDAFWEASEGTAPDRLFVNGPVTLDARGVESLEAAFKPAMFGSGGGGE